MTAPDERPAPAARDTHPGRTSLTTRITLACVGVALVSAVLSGLAVGRYVTSLERAAPSTTPTATATATATTTAGAAPAPHRCARSCGRPARPVPCARPGASPAPCCCRSRSACWWAPPRAPARAACSPGRCAAPRRPPVPWAPAAVTCACR
ncbi:hypothetical protein [Cellulomonas soli]